MPLSEDFRQRLASQFRLHVEQVGIDDDGVVIYGERLPDVGVAVRMFLDTYQVVELTSNFARFVSASRHVLVQKVSLRECQDRGLLEIAAGTTWLFLGNFGANTETIDLSECPELLLGIASLPPLKEEADSRNWTSIIEQWGPLVITYADLPEASLAEVGCFCSRESITPLSFDPPSQMSPFIRRPQISTESVQAYVLALEATDGPDVTFHRFYRIFELEFAVSLKAEIAATPVREIYKKLKDLKITELKALDTTVMNSLVPFTDFSLSDFDSLFGPGHLPPSGGSYQILINWLKNKTPNNPPNECRAQLLYYVRNALVHSKIADGDTFLLGPYEGARAIGLINLVRDMKRLIRDLVAL